MGGPARGSLPPSTGIPPGMDNDTILAIVAVGLIAAGVALLANDRTVRMVGAIGTLVLGAVALLGVLLR